MIFGGIIVQVIKCGLGPRQKNQYRGRCRMGAVAADPVRVGGGMWAHVGVCGLEGNVGYRTARSCVLCRKPYSHGCAGDTGLRAGCRAGLWQRWR